MHYRRWLNDGDPGGVDKRAPGAGVHSYPADDQLVALMRSHRDFNGVAAGIGVARESLRDYLAARPTLMGRMLRHQRPNLTPEQALENARRSGREWARRWRSDNPAEARRVRRVQMAAYGPEYRQRWNHYNRLRRLGSGAAPPDELSREYALVLRGDPCCYCGTTMEHVDHIESLAHAGDGSWDNLTAACADCNFRKGARPLLMFMLANVVG